MIRLIVALGNPGVEYELTRHNIGWILVDTHPEISRQSWKDKFKGEFTHFNVKGEKVYVLKPMTYMNLSGESVKAMSDFFKISVSEILVIHDELDLEFGQIHFKKGGGLAGHNGLKSMAKLLASQEFYRMRVGIGRPEKGSVSNWVLSKFPVSQNTELELLLKGANEALDTFLTQGFKKASNQFNKKNFLKI